MSKLTTIEFHGDTLFAIEDEGAPFVAIKPITDRLGLDWSSQHKRINRDPILAQGMVMMTIPSAGGAQETAALRLDLLNGWLFGIDASRVKMEFRESVLSYKRDCYTALFEHFYGRRDAERLPHRDAFDPTREEPVPVRRSLVTEARHTFGAKAAGSLWFALGLPVVPEMHEGSRQTEFGFTYTAMPAPAGRQAAP